MKKIKMSVYRNPEDENDYCAWHDSPVKYQHWEYLRQIEVEVPEKKKLYVYKDIHTGNYRIYVQTSINPYLEFVTKVEIEE